jgi:hypothetical protein
MADLQRCDYGAALFSLSKRDGRGQKIQSYFSEHTSTTHHENEAAT